MPECDYSRDNHYFITTVVKNRLPYLGNIENGTMILNENGKIVLNQLNWLSKQYAYVKLHAHMVMPDHVHAIIEIDQNGINNQKIKSLSELTGAFKMTASKQIRLNGLSDFQWQTSFHDRIIRNQMEFDRITKYIWENPLNWDKK